jgi:RNA polymerase sigma-70 factor (ECF subfamily)
MDLKELTSSAQEGNAEAFAELVRGHHFKVHSLAMGFMKNPAVADDLCQEIFLKAYLALPKFRFGSEFGTWLYRIAVNHIRDFIRKEARRKEISLESIGDVPASGDLEEKQEEEHRAQSLKKLIDREIEALPADSRIILTLRDIRGLSYEEISKMLKLSPGTVDSRLYRARKRLRERLSPLLKKEGDGDELP